ncbi:hypothetical protein E5Q_05175 [Mixia osmundae IAM 14324]|uniref:Uncharacterized protein n=2 Tax=Mixia osmundae (strain CBS 9802 / IAM 14324 / JCM 22182 / KY 12970) TaxID=764103 RepID=G7E6M9_MIXOS|nr:hypothetical protein E5Q_05175 [Mixia osmundae IAM 14324]
MLEAYDAERANRHAICADLLTQFKAKYDIGILQEARPMPVSSPQTSARAAWAQHDSSRSSQTPSPAPPAVQTPSLASQTTATTAATSIRSMSRSPGRLVHLPTLSQEHYGLRFLSILHEEFRARKEVLTSADIYMTTLEVEQLPASAISPARQLYAFDAKNIREGWPPVEIGDRILLRQLYPEHLTAQGTCFAARVHAISRVQGRVIVRCDALLQNWVSGYFNVQFTPQSQYFSAIDETLQLYQSLLDPSHFPLSHYPGGPSPAKQEQARAWLFPTEELASRVGYSSLHSLERWRDEHLNAEQRRAITDVTLRTRRVPYLIHGPAGTGKTKTLVECVLQILEHDPNAHLLVVGSSNPSADTLAKRLRSHLDPSVMLRLQDASRPFTEVVDDLLMFAHIEDDRFAMPSLQALLAKRVIVTTCLDAQMLLHVGCTNGLLQQIERNVMRSIHPLAPLSKVAQPHFTHLLVDEAGQCCEPEVLLPLAVMLPSGELDDRVRQPQIVLCGDVKQLGPTIDSEEARAHDFDQSLLERLSELPLYAEHPSARSKGTSRTGRSPLPPRPVHFADLTRNYRSHPGLLMMPSALFYDNSLRAEAAEQIKATPLLSWSGLSGSHIPLLFHGVDGEEDWVDEGASWYNVTEVDRVVAYVSSLLGSFKGRLQPSEISVISPFREQVWRVRLALRSRGLSQVDVGNVEALQGAENRVVIISTVRSRRVDFLADDALRNRGLIHQPKRLNVAITRPKELLIIVGNGKTLIEDVWWRKILQFCQRHSLYRGASFPGLESTELNEISLLEETYQTNPDHFRSLVSSMARTTLSCE